MRPSKHRMQRSFIAIATLLPMFVVSHQDDSLASPGLGAATPSPIRTRVHVTSVELTFDRLVGASDEIVLARVTRKSNSTWCNEFATTDVTFSVIERRKGTGDQELTVKIAGGSTGEVTTIVPDAPDFQVGDTAVLFLQRFDGLRERFLVGLAQGAYRVTTDSGFPIVRGRWAENEMLDTFLGRVSASASTGAGK